MSSSSCEVRYTANLIPLHYPAKVPSPLRNIIIFTDESIMIPDNFVTDYVDGEDEGDSGSSMEYYTSAFSDWSESTDNEEVDDGDTAVEFSMEFEVEVLF